MAAKQLGLDARKIKADFPILNREINGSPLTYLDSGATSQKPMAVIEAMNNYYENINANVHRGAHYLGEQATNAMEEAREKIKTFIGANSPKEIIFSKNATESLNLTAHSLGSRLEPGDVILLSILEHHSNIVPWQMLAAQKGLEIRWMEMDEQGYLNLENLDELLEGVKIVGITAMSNVLGTIPPIGGIAEAAHSRGALVVVDGCQFVPHSHIDVNEMGADFVAFSGHKMCGPTGIGVLWGRQGLLEEMPPFLGGGEMILNVTTEGFIPNELPWKFEAGTPPIAETVGLGAAVDYLTDKGMHNIRAHEMELTSYALEKLGQNPNLEIFGPTNIESRGSAISFAYKDVHPHDVSQVLDQYGISVRAGHHCAKPLMKALGVGATIRASLYIYNDTADIDYLLEKLGKVSEIF